MFYYFYFNELTYVLKHTKTVILHSTMDPNVNQFEETLNSLNSVGVHATRKITLNKLQTNKSYPILWAEKTYKYNQSKKIAVRLEIKDFFLYLPKRFNRLPNKNWDDLADGGYEMCILERDGRKIIRIKFTRTTPVKNMILID